MGYGCYRHEVDAGSTHWNSKFDSMLENGRAHKEPFTWGRDNQICPFCWDEMSRIRKIYEKALAEIQEKPEAATLIALHAFEEAERIELHPMDTEPPQKEKKARA